MDDCFIIVFTTLSLTHATTYRDDLVETAGATYGLHLLGTTFFSAGDLIFTEDLTYFVAIEMFKRTIEFNIETGKM